MTLLELKDVSVQYGRIRAVRNLSFAVDEGEVVSLIGANGAGKTTTMKTISGLLDPSGGSIHFDGDDITRTKAHLRVVRGISQSPEGRGVFPGMTVIENLEMGAYARKDRAGIAAELERVFDLFPRLKERRRQVGGTMSGGEQQMLAIGRALMSRPRLLLLDEPVAGMGVEESQRMVKFLATLKGRMTMILVEHDMDAVFTLADRISVLVYGRVIATGRPEDIRANPEVRAAYLGEDEAC